MLKKITLSNIATFKEEQSLEPKRVNFIFGHNGSGKSTLGRFLATSDEEKTNKYPNCSLEWENNTSLTTHLYTSDYVSKNFQDGKLEGIFSLGEENNDIQKQLDEKRKAENEKAEEINKVNAALKTNEQAIESETNKFKDALWNIQKDLGNWIKTPLKGSFKGRDSFFEIFKTQEGIVKQRELQDEENLRKRTQTLFDNKSEQVSPINIPNSSTTLKQLEETSILGDVIAGAKNSPLAQWIEKLDAEQWFKEGTSFVLKSDPNCPFCQQTLPQDFKNNLKKYFDRAYEDNLNAIGILQSQYENEIQKWNNLSSDITNHEEFLENFEELKDLEKLHYTQLEINLSRIKEKLKFPNLTFTIEKNILETREKLLEGLQKANLKIQQHNQDIAEREKRKKEITADIWRLIVNKSENEYRNYQTEYKKLKREENDLNTSKKTAKDKKNKLHLEIEDLQKKTKNIHAVAEDINKLLKSCGFCGFELKVEETENSDIPFYKLIRTGNGENALETISEGEKSFISFLYFYNKIQKEKEDCVIIFDDPVTSMDAETLFATNAFIRTICDLSNPNLGTDKHKKNIPSHVKQIFILTHNVYFYHRIVHHRGNKQKSNPHANTQEFNFITFSKDNNSSKIQEYIASPIKSTYETWWEAVREAKKNLSTPYPALANICRLILENFCSLLGYSKKFNTLIEKFEMKERPLIASMIETFQEGSHAFHEDAHAVQSNEHLINILEEIFTGIGHSDYYKMMIREEEP